MNRIATANNLKRRLPSVNSVLQEMADAIHLRGHSEVSKVVGICIDGLRQDITQGANPEISIDRIKAASIEHLETKKPAISQACNQSHRHCLTHQLGACSITSGGTGCRGQSGRSPEQPRV